MIIFNLDRAHNIFYYVVIGSVIVFMHFMLAKCKQKILQTQKNTRISRLNIQNTRFNEVTNHNISALELSLSDEMDLEKPLFMRVARKFI